MYTELRSPNVHEPKTVGEYSDTVINYKGNINSLWAGGTFIMSRKDFYPSPTTNVEIINLKDIEELYRLQRNDRYAEIGSMVSLNDIAQLGKNIFLKTIISAIEHTACRMLRERISIGGTLCTQGFTSSVASVLVLLDTAVELIIPKKRNYARKWLHASRLYDKNGRLTLHSNYKNALVSKLRIAIQNFDFEYFNTSGSPMLEPESSVSLATVAKLDQNGIASARIIITFPSRGFVYNRDIDNMLGSLQLPADDMRCKDVEKFILSFIRDNIGKITPIQEARLKGMMNDMIMSLNQHILTM